VLTSDGSGGIVAESNLTFDSGPGPSLNRLALTGFQTITDIVGTQLYSLQIGSSQTTQTTGHSSVDVSNYGDGTTVLDVTGQRVLVSDATTLNTGIGVSVGGLIGDGVGLNISNTIATTGDRQKGASIAVTGAGSASPMPGVGSTKTGVTITVSNTAKSNTGLTVTALDAARNYAIITTEGSSIFNDSQNSSSDFSIKGGIDANLLFVSATNDAVGIGVSPLTKLDVLGDYRFVHDPNVELPVNFGDPSGYGDIVTFGNAAGGFAAGLVHYLDTATNEWTPTDPTGAAISTNLLALALGASPADGMLIRGYAQYTTFRNTPFTLGAPLYLSYSSNPFPIPPDIGIMSNTAPTGVGEIVRIVGYCVGDASTYDRIYFNPSNDWIEL
jgi:hypothetical protein